MPNGTYNPCDPLTRITSGFDRPQDLQCIMVDGVRVFVGYLDQCERNLVDFKGGVIRHMNIGSQSVFGGF
jgi:hypothetical protein